MLIIKNRFQNKDCMQVTDAPPIFNHITCLQGHPLKFMMQVWSCCFEMCRRSCRVLEESLKEVVGGKFILQLKTLVIRAQRQNIAPASKRSAVSAAVREVLRLQLTAVGRLFAQKITTLLVEQFLDMRRRLGEGTAYGRPLVHKHAISDAFKRYGLALFSQEYSQQISTPKALEKLQVIRAKLAVLQTFDPEQVGEL